MNRTLRVHTSTKLSYYDVHIFGVWTTRKSTGANPYQVSEPKTYNISKIRVSELASESEKCGKFRKNVVLSQVQIWNSTETCKVEINEDTKIQTLLALTGKFPGFWENEEITYDFALFFRLPKNPSSKLPKSIESLKLGERFATEKGRGQTFREFEAWIPPGPSEEVVQQLQKEFLDEGGEKDGNCYFSTKDENVFYVVPRGKHFWELDVECFYGDPKVQVNIPKSIVDTGAYYTHIPYKYAPSELVRDVSSDKKKFVVTRGLKFGEKYLKNVPIFIDFKERERPCLIGVKKCLENLNFRHTKEGNCDSFFEFK